jgi:hypothetical protein
MSEESITTKLGKLRHIRHARKELENREDELLRDITKCLELVDLQTGALVPNLVPEEDILQTGLHEDDELIRPLRLGDQVKILNFGINKGRTGKVIKIGKMVTVDVGGAQKAVRLEKNLQRVVGDQKEQRKRKSNRPFK